MSCEVFSAFDALVHSADVDGGSDRTFCSTPKPINFHDHGLLP